MAKQASIKPLADNVLIRPLEAQAKTATGIILPDSAQKKPQAGEIMAVGPGRYEDGKLVPMSLKVGQKVLYKKWGGNEIEVGQEEWMLIEEKDVMAVID